jgi:hypothetical protein
LSDSSSPPIDYLAAAHDLVGNDLGVDERRKGHDLWKPGVEVTTLLFRDRDLLNAIGCLEKNTGTPNSVYSALQNAPERLSRARREMILDGMLRSTAPELVVAGLHAVPDLSGRVCGQLCTMPLQQPPRQIVLAFCLSQMTLPPVVRERVGTRMLDDMLEAVRIWVSRVAEHDFQRASQLMKIHGRDWYSSWQTLAARERKSAGRRDWRRREKR